jgi:competence protein ComGF
MMNLLDTKEIKKIVGLFLVIGLLSSCGSYNYSSGEDRSIKITSDNLQDFQVFSPRSSNKLSTASNGVARPRIEKLKKDYLTVLLSHPNYDPQLIYIKRVPRAKALAKDIGLGVFTFGIPVLVDVFNSDFYKVSPKTKEFNIHFEYKQSFMTEEYAKIKDSKNPEDFKTWLSKYTKSVHFQEATDKKDSLELSIALFQETESAIDEFIASHQSSNYLSQAQKIKDEMVAARELFAKTKTENTVSAYESFLEKYPRSLHNKEAHKLLTEAAEKVAVTSLNSTSMVNYMKTYLIPNASFFNTTELDLRKSKISKAIDAQLIKDNIKTDPKKTYDYYSNLWKAYINMRNQGLEPYLNHLEHTYSYQSKICDVLFLKVKDANTADKQSTLVAKINSDFPTLDIYDSIKNPLLTILQYKEKGSGIVKLYNVGFLRYFFDNMSERDVLIGRDYYTYKDSTYTSLKGITYEEISFTNGFLNGVSKAYRGNQLDIALNLSNNTGKDISYYQNGTLVLSTFFPASESSYYYEYENGTNLTLKVINDVMAQLNVVESNVKGYMKTKNYDQMVVEFKKVPVILDPAIELLSNNPIPKEKGSNLLLSKGKVLDGLLNTAVANKNAEEKAAQEKRTKELLALWSSMSNSSSSSGSYNSGGNSSSVPSAKSNNVRGRTKVFVCNDCGKVQVSESAPFDKSTCPETRWGGIGGAGNIWDDGDHQYSNMGSSGSNQYVCSRCNIAIMLYESPQNKGDCGASGSNCCSHNWKKN